MMNGLYDKAVLSFGNYFVPFFKDYFCPKTLEEAMSLLVNYGNEAKLMAGGTDLVNLMRTRALMPKYIIDITRIPELDYIRYDEKDGLRIGALTTLSAIQLSGVVRENSSLLYEAVCQMGSVQVRNKATIGGNICRASPSADTAPPLLALDAKVKIAGPAKGRIMPLEDFFTGPGKTAIRHNEILTEIQMPELPARTGTAFLKASRIVVDLAKVNAAIVLTVKDRVCEDVRIALGAVAPTPIRAKKAEELLKGEKLEDKVIKEAAETAAGETQCISDLRASADYREELSKVLVRRAIKLSLERAEEKVRG